MSWSIGKEVRVPEELNGLMPTYSVTPAATEQIERAIEVAKSILVSGVIGKDKQFQVSLSGHANNNHEPAVGWANDCITVTIYQK